VTVALDRRFARLLALTALGFATLVLAAPSSPAATAVSTSLCRTAERQDARYSAPKLRFYRAWQGSPSVGPNWERAALVAGDMARIARSAIGAAELAEVETDDGRRLQAKLLRVHRAQRAAAVLYVDAALLLGAGGPTERVRRQRSMRAGRMFLEANTLLLRAGFVGQFC
jgi:hypothetical protein